MWRKSLVGTLLIIATLLFAGKSVHAQSSQSDGDGNQQPRVSLNQAYVKDVQVESSAVDLGNLMSVFDFIFTSLDDTVTVYPTENYFYFRFYLKGVEWAGNIRLDIIDRDKGAVHFAYFESTNLWAGDGVSSHRTLGPDDGVVLKKVDDLAYDLTFKERTVRFNLNDLSEYPVPEHFLRDNEIYLGPVFDESGIEFHLVHDKELKNFLYVLNESKPVPDKLEALPTAQDIFIGRRTGFAYFRDARKGRKILIGVHDSNVSQNTYFDGPFDQLPDNFLDRKAFRKALKRSFPGLPESIDDFGNFEGGEGRVLINPYKTYSQPTDLVGISDCAAAAKEDGPYYTCFQSEE